jgi:FkbM family methyltransferase
MFTAVGPQMATALEPVVGMSMEHPTRDALFDMVQPKRLTAVVDIGANPIDGDPPYKEMLSAGLCTVIGFEPQPDALAVLNRRRTPREQYLSYAVGDGRERSLHVCREQGMTSLLAPDRAHLDLFTGFAGYGALDKEVPVATRRLDDIDEIECMDFLKIDIQGSELDVFESGRRRLASAVAVQTEVSFVTLYQQQPAFGVIDTFLRQLGFIPHCFAEMKLRPLAPLIFDRDPTKGVRQLLEADVVYVRDFSRPENMDVEQWKHLALIAHHCYESFDLVFHALTAAAKLGGVRPGTPEKYLKLIQSLGIPVALSRTGAA